MSGSLFSCPQLPGLGQQGVRMEGTLQIPKIVQANKERYFRLRCANGYAVMEKYKDSREPGVRDAYNISIDTEVRHSEKSGAFWFALVMKGKTTHRFGALTSLERVQWIKAIEKCVQELKSRRVEVEEEVSEFGDAEVSLSDKKGEAASASTLKIEVDSLARELRGKRGIRKKTHYFEYQNVKSSFKGTNIVKWLLKNRFSIHREHALEVGYELLKAGKIARVDGGRVFDGDSELYVFNKAVGVTPNALIKDIDTLTEKLNGLSVEIYQVENSSEELYDMLQEQISQLKQESTRMRRHIEWLTGIVLCVTCGVFIIGFSGNLSDMTFFVRVVMLLLMVAATTLGVMLLNLDMPKAGFMGDIKTRIDEARARVRKGLDKVPQPSDLKSPAKIRRGHLRSPSAQQSKSSLQLWTSESVHDGTIPARSAPSSPKGRKSRRARLASRTRVSSKGANRNPLGEDEVPDVLRQRSVPIPRENISTSATSPRSLKKDTKQRAPVKGERKAKDEKSLKPGVDWKKAGKGIIYRHSTPENSKDCWSMPLAEEFKVRGPGYLTDGVKIVSKPYRFTVACCEMCAVEEKIDHIANYKHSAIHKLRRENKYEKGSHPFPIDYLVIQFQLPGISFTMYMQANVGQNPNEEVCKGYADLVAKFVNGTDDFRNSRFKIVPTVREGGWMVKKMVGAKPALLGRKISCVHSKGEDYLEIDVDIASSYVAQKILGVVQGYCKTLKVDLGFLIEGREEKELPEVMLGAVRFHNVDLGAIPKLNLEASAESSE